MNKINLYFLILISFLFIYPTLIKAETNEIIILLKESDKFFNERDFNKYLETNKKLYLKSKDITPNMVEGLCRIMFDKYIKITTEIELQGKIDDHTNFIMTNEKFELTNKRNLNNDDFNDLANQAFSNSAIIYDNSNNIIQISETVASYKLNKFIQEIKNSTSVKVYFENQNSWNYQYDINTNEIDIIISGLLLSQEYRDWNSNGIFEIKIVFNTNNKSYQMFLGHEQQYYVDNLLSCEGDYPIKGNKIFSEIVLKYSIYKNNFNYPIDLEPSYINSLSRELQEKICMVNMKRYKTTDKSNHHCTSSLKDSYIINTSGNTVEVNCPTHGKILIEK